LLTAVGAAKVGVVAGAVLDAWANTERLVATNILAAKRLSFIITPKYVEHALIIY
jgi:hypothetical protein